MGHVNKHVFNKIELRRGVRAVLGHVGRTSGRPYRTPLEAHPVDGGFLVAVIYGSRTDWLRNVMEAGCAELELHGERVALSNPRMVPTDVARSLIRPWASQPPEFLGASFLQMDATSIVVGAPTA